MLTPCSPCSCPGAPCEQCMFGYQSDKSNHKTMKNLIERTLRGEKPNGYAVAERYMNIHKNWQNEMQENIEERRTVGMLKTGIMVKCARCGKEQFFADETLRGDSEYKYNSSNWAMIDGCHACPDCYKMYETLMKSFWNDNKED